ncbi:MAG: PAS domain S-box protein [Fulvivirga sp.]|nr:PAS domain S-box protein [Fulvivirga sp.]
MDELHIDRHTAIDFIANSPEAICVLDDQQKVIGWNKALEQLTGQTKLAAFGKQISDIFHPLDSDGFHLKLEQALLGTGVVCESPLITNEGKFLKVSLSPSQCGDGKYVVMAIFRSFEQRMAGQSRFKPLIEDSPIATAIYDATGSPKYFNRAYGSIWNADKKAHDHVIEHYNILQDEQLVEIGIMPLIEKAFAGDTAHIPPVPYTPSKTHSISNLSLKEQRYIKGHIFPIKNEEHVLQEVVMVLTDVTYQKQAEQILSETNIKFKMLTIGLPGVIYEYEIIDGKQTRFKYISEGCKEMFGETPEAILENDKLLLEKIHPDDLDNFKHTSELSDQKLKPWHWEGRIMVNGTEKWIEGKSNPVKTNKGDLIRYGLLLDVTDKKRVELQAKVSEERLQLALNGAAIGLWEWDGRKRKAIINNTWAEKLGYGQNELEKELGEWLSMIHPSDRKAVRDELRDHLSGKHEFFESEYRLRTKQGGYRWVLDKGKILEKDQEGKVIKASGTYLDIDDKKRSDILIKRNERLFTQLFDNSPLGIVMLDQHHEVLQVNHGFENIFGYSKQQVVGKRLNDLIVPEEHKEEAIAINKLTSSGQVGQLESVRLSKSGEKKPVIIYGVPVSFDNETIGIYGIYVDIAERKKTEQELKIRNNELDNFVYKVSHDLRAPLSSILGIINLANHEKNEDDIRDYIEIIESRVKQLDSFINDVLSHSKNLKMAISTDLIDLQAVVNKCFNDLDYLAEAERVQKKISISGEAFYSDRWRINEIFRNLISNAIKYLNPEADQPCVDVNIKINKDEALIVIEDNGIGIEPDECGKVFEMFYRATERAEGSGIGLYIVKNAVEKLGGTIHIKSKPQKGTTFVLKIPNQKQVQEKES